MNNFGIKYILKTLSFLIVTKLCLGVKLSSPETHHRNDRVVVCYIGTWAVYRPARGSFNLANIDTDLCTHLVYSFVGLNSATNEVRSIDPYFDLEENYGKGSFRKMTDLRTKNPNLKITLAVGGWNEGSSNYSTMAMTYETRQIFIKSVLELLLKYNFDGFDLDWEYPTLRGGRSQDKVNFASLVKELKTELKKHNMLLTSAIGAAPETLDSAYDIPEISKYLDYLHLMAYDYYGNWDRKVGPNAPLLGDKLSVEKSIQHILKLGAPAEKLVVGLPVYGHTFIVDENVEPNMGASTMEKSFQGPFTRQDGFMGYNEICLELQRNKSWEILWDEKSVTPYAVNGKMVVSYDDERSLTEKVKTALKYNVGGLMMWSIDTDDFRGDCDVNKPYYRTIQEETDKKYSYPLLRAVHRAIQEYVTDDNSVDNVPPISPVNNNSITSSVDYLHSQFCFVFMSVLCYFRI